jgi:hypothetical protein
MKMFNPKKYNRSEIVEHTGSENWDWVEDWFSGKSEGEILAECNRVWRDDSNEDLAHSIYEELGN